MSIFRRKRETEQAVTGTFASAAGGGYSEQKGVAAARSNSSGSEKNDYAATGIERDPTGAVGDGDAYTSASGMPRATLSEGVPTGNPLGSYAAVPPSKWDLDGAVQAVTVRRDPTGVQEVIGPKQVQEAYQILQKYKAGKANLEQRLIRNEQWYKLRHWEYLRSVDNKEQVEPVSAWLFNSIANKHADAMDNFPAPNILPREESDKQEAKTLSSIVPVLLAQCNFEQVYSDAWDDKLKGGTSIYGVFWDKSKLGGLGDVAIHLIDAVNLFWEPGVSDIQKSRNVFHVELQNNDQLAETWPQLKGKLGSSAIDVSKYIYDDTVDTSSMSAVVDWYYKKRNAQGKTVLHFCKFVGSEVLYASENTQDFAMRGWYDHGQYPFVFDTMFRVKGSPCGFGFIDVAKSAQEYIDRGNQAIMKNMLSNATPRHFIRSDGSVNEEEYLDLSKPLIHVDGQLGNDSILPVHVNTPSSIYVEILNNKIDELKETTGNRDISTGGTASGVTAASAIAAMQEAGSKLSRDSNKAAYRAFRKVVELVIELIRQFYDTARCFRITGENAAHEFVQFSNSGIAPQAQGNEYGIDMGYRLPLFDIEITAQKASPYSKLSQNELALQFFGQGFFNPQMADQALACLEMMDFDRKDFVIQKIAQNGGMYRQMMQMQEQILMLTQIIDQYRGTNMAQQMAASMNGQSMPAAASGETQGAKSDVLGAPEKVEPTNTKKARQKVAESTAPS